MAKRKYTWEEILHKLQDADMALGQGTGMADACRQLGAGVMPDPGPDPGQPREPASMAPWRT